MSYGPTKIFLGFMLGLSASAGARVRNLDITLLDRNWPELAPYWGIFVAIVSVALLIGLMRTEE